eukprot:4736748-Pleurochrysis_carterae.AAC.4
MPPLRRSEPTCVGLQTHQHVAKLPWRGRDSFPPLCTMLTASSNYEIALQTCPPIGSLAFLARCSRQPSIDRPLRTESRPSFSRLQTTLQAGTTEYPGANCLYSFWRERPCASLSLSRAQPDPGRLRLSFARSPFFAKGRSLFLHLSLFSHPLFPSSFAAKMGVRQGRPTPSAAQLPCLALALLPSAPMEIVHAELSTQGPTPTLIASSTAPYSEACLVFFVGIQ